MVKKSSVKGLEGISSAYELLENLQADPSLLSVITSSSGHGKKSQKRMVGKQVG